LDRCRHGGCEPPDGRAADDPAARLDRNILAWQKAACLASGGAATAVETGFTARLSHAPIVPCRRKQNRACGAGFGLRDRYDGYRAAR